jgi:long-chain acyl-CoA synthetase
VNYDNSNKNVMAASLERGLSSCPAAPAIICGTAEFTYTEFTSRVRRLAGALRTLGLKPGDRVAAVSTNCHRILELYIGVPAAGLIFVPLSPRLGRNEIRHALKDSGASLVFTDQDGLDGVGGDFYSLVHDYDSLISGAEEAAFSDVEADTVATIFYTGGTTGGAKGVKLTHHNLACNAETWTSEWSFDEDVRWALIAPMSHLAGTNAILTTVAHAGCHVVLPSFSAAGALDLIERWQVTATLVVPTMLAAMAEEQRVMARDVSSLANLSHGGSPISTDTLRRAHEMFPYAGLMEIYGTTETAPNITFLPREENLLNSPKIRSCGRPVPGVEIAVVDDDNEPVPLGSFGEVVVRGPLVMAGYWNNPDATEAAIICNWYHTGDIGMRDSDGYLYLVDRKKDVIVTGGENVYSVEVEGVLYDHPLVLEAAVFGIPDKKWGEAVHAVVTTRGHVEPAELIEHCRARMAPFKVPKSVRITVGPLAKSAAGKILKRVLREPYWSGRDERIAGS